MNLTQKETNALKAITRNGLEGMGGTEPKDLYDDNYSWFDSTDLVNILGISQAEARGIMSALNEKDLIFDYEGDGSGWCLTENGIHEAEGIWDL